MAHRQLFDLAWLPLLVVLRSAFLVEAHDPVPLVASTSTDYLGYDGLWSPVNIRVGSTEQYISVLPSTLSQETWAVGSAGCDGTTTCEKKRGGLFLSNESSTFKSQGFYELDFDAQLGDSGLGYYGLDTIAFDDQTTVPNEIVAVVNATEYWIGSMGLGVQQSRFTASDDVSPLLSSLVENGNHIPSRSYGYTAGASYRLKGVAASLILGGIDANRFVPNDMTFTLSQDYAPVVAINSISVSAGTDNLPDNWNTNPQTLLDSSQADLFTIDSSTPFLWLPERACDSFAEALNLTYDEELQLYLFTPGEESSPDVLSSWNLTFTFAISNLPNATNTIDLTLPYDAFNLQLTYPFPYLAANFTSPPTNYFPLRKAANSTQYTIGRAFLQETYLMVDYERNNFGLSQAIFTEDAVSNVNLLSVTRPADSIWPGPRTSSGLSTGAEVAIAFAITIGLVLALGTLWYFCFRKLDRPDSPGAEKPRRRKLFSRSHRSPDSQVTISELLGDKRHPTEAPADSSATRFELSASTPVEMPAAAVSPTFFQGDEGEQRATTVMRNNPRRPAELDPQHPVDKATEAFATASVRSASPVPAYSPTDTNHNLSAGVSPYSMRNSPTFGRVSSEGPGVSPVGTSHARQISNTNSGSIPSPISPEVASRPRGFGNSNPHSPTSSSGRNSLAVPQLNGRPPSRSPSTGSRFVEEGLASVVEERRPSQPPPVRPNVQRARFSFEQ